MAQDLKVLILLMVLTKQQIMLYLLSLLLLLLSIKVLEYTLTPSTNSAHAGNFRARLSASDGAEHNPFSRFYLAVTPVEYLVMAAVAAAVADRLLEAAGCRRLSYCN